MLKDVPTSVDLQRVEFATLVKGMGVPFIQMLHGEGAPKLQMDSLLKSYRYVHNINEWLAVKACDKFMCVNPLITERIRATYPASAGKIDTQTTWVIRQGFCPDAVSRRQRVAHRVRGPARSVQTSPADVQDHRARLREAAGS